MKGAGETLLPPAAATFAATVRRKALCSTESAACAGAEAALSLVSKSSGQIWSRTCALAPLLLPTP